MSNITIKTFKLVPIKDFEKLALNKDPKCRKGDDGGNASAPQRTIKDIVDSSSLENTEFEPSKHYVAEQKFLQKGSGAAATPVWLPNEKQLPQFSRGSRIKRSYDDMSDILNNNSISDDLKVRLYAMARKKYKSAMSVGETDDVDGGADDDDCDGAMSYPIYIFQLMQLKMMSLLLFVGQYYIFCSEDTFGGQSQCEIDLDFV